MSATPLLVSAALLGASGVALGAFGAHGLEARLGPGGIDIWQTAVMYHLIHALAVLCIGVWLRAASRQAAGAWLEVAGWSFAAGVVLFSGSLYLLAVGGPHWLGPVTPLGGVAFILGWLALLRSAARQA